MHVCTVSCEMDSIGFTKIMDATREYVMIRVYAVVHVPTRVLGPNRACDPHIPFISAGPQSTRLRGSRPPSTK